MKLPSAPLASIPKTKIGSCPHGLPMGACPICNGMGGGGGSSKKADKASGEMSWSECFAIGQMMKNQKLAQQQQNLAMQGQGAVNLPTRLENMALKIAVLADRIANFIHKIQVSSLPKIISKPIELALKIAMPMLNLIKNVPIIIQNTINFIREKFVDISDKLNAVFGELKNSIEKKISERFKDIKNKMKSLFGLFEPIEEEINETKIVKTEKKFFSLFTSHLSLNKKEIENDSN